MAFFAFLPVVARWADDTLLRMDKLGVAGADAFGLFGVIMAGAYFGAYYGKHGTIWKGWRLGVVVPTLAIFAVISIPAVVLNAAGDRPDGEDGGLAVIAVSNTITAALGAVLGANIGWWYRAGKTGKIMSYLKEAALLLVIFAGAGVVAYVQDAENPATQSCIVQLMNAAAVVAGAALGAHYGSITIRYGDRPSFGQFAAAVLGSAIFIHIVMDTFHISGERYIVWLSIAIISTAIGKTGAMLGAHISARLHMRVGTG